MTTSPQVQAGLGAGIQEAEVLQAGVGPALPVNAQIVLALSIQAALLVQQALSQGTDVTDADVQALFNQFQVGQKDDLLAQQEARAKGDTTGATP